MICYLFSEPTYFLFSSDVPALLYYAQIPASIISLIISFYAFWNGRQFLLNKLLLTISILFSLWTLINLITWTNINSDIIMFVWSFFGLIMALISIFSIYFVYVFLDGKDISLKIKLIFLGTLSPVIALTPTRWNIFGFNITNCDAFNFEQLPFKIYYSLSGLLAIIWILVLLVRRYRVASPSFKKQIVLVGLGIELFLASFFVMVFLGSYLTQIGILPDSSIELYGLFGMVIFMIYISILMVRFKAFNVKLVAAQALVWAIGLSVASQFLFIKVTLNYFLNSITLFFVLIGGYFLVKSVKKEIAQKEEIALLAEDVKRAYVIEKRAKEEIEKLDKFKDQFLMTTQHNLRTPLTSMMGYTDLLLRGAFGKQNQATIEVIEKFQTLTRGMIKMVNDFLNMAQFQMGRDVVALKPGIELGIILQEIITELEFKAKLKNIYLKIEKPENIPALNADREKLKAALFNVIDNAVKYTLRGGVTVMVECRAPVIKIIISDTGIGIPKEEIADLFENIFNRGEKAKRLDNIGSGIGLYLSGQIIKAHKGRIWVDSGKSGSTFYIELPLS